MNKVLKKALILGAVVVGLSVMKNGIIQAMIEKAISSAAHVPVHIGRTQAKILSTSIRLDRLRVFNPNGFPEKVMLDAPIVSVDYELAPLFKGQVYFKEVTIDLKELIVVKNREGKLNINAVKPTTQENAKLKEKQKQIQEKNKPMKLQIDRLRLSIGRVVYRDYSGGRSSPAEQVFEINMRDRIFTNISDPAVVVNIVMFEALTRTTLSRILSLDTDTFKEGTMNALSKSFDLVDEGSQTIEKTAKSLFKLFN